jgi:D-hydroxyproline dehydrogenase subunit alpha
VTEVVSRFDVVIVGGGPAGLAAAVSASWGTSSVAVVDEGMAPGGQIWRRDSRDGHSKIAREWLRALDRTATAWLDRATVIDAFRSRGGHRLVIERDGRRVVVESATVILAAGARELFLPFPGWTLPGVAGVGGLQALAKSGLSVRGKRVVLAGTGPLLMAVAASLARRGAEIVALVEQAPVGSMTRFAVRMLTRPRTALDALRYASELSGGTVRLGQWVAAANGRGRLETVVVTDGLHEQAVGCDLLGTGYGLVPNTELASLLGCRVGHDGIEVDSRQRTSVNGVFAAGECVGIGGVETAVLEGSIAGQVAAGLSVSDFTLSRRDRSRRWSRTLDAAFALRPEVTSLARPDTIVCRCEDVSLGAIDEHWEPRQAKLYTRAGMGACQGRVCNTALRSIRGWARDTVRAPVQPAFLSTLAALGAGESSGAS